MIGMCRQPGAAHTLLLSQTGSPRASVAWIIHFQKHSLRIPQQEIPQACTLCCCTQTWGAPLKMRKRWSSHLQGNTPSQFPIYSWRAGSGPWNPRTRTGPILWGNVANEADQLCWDTPWHSSSCSKDKCLFIALESFNKKFYWWQKGAECCSKRIKGALPDHKMTMNYQCDTTLNKATVILEYINDYFQ